MEYKNSTTTKTRRTRGIALASSTLYILRISLLNDSGNSGQLCLYSFVLVSERIYVRNIFQLLLVSVDFHPCLYHYRFCGPVLMKWLSPIDRRVIDPLGDICCLHSTRLIYRLFIQLPTDGFLSRSIVDSRAAVPSLWGQWVAWLSIIYS